MRNFHRELIKWHEEAIIKLKDDYRKEREIVQSYHANSIKDRNPTPKKIGKFNRMVKTAKSTRQAIRDRENDLRFLKNIPEKTFNRIYGWGYATGMDKEARRI